jgi:WD40 repeat protein
MVVVAADANGRIHFWDLQSGKELTTRQGRSLELLDLTWSPDGPTVAPKLEDSTMLVWDVIGMRPEPDVAEYPRSVGLRGVEVLEHCSTVQARALLETLAAAGQP